MHTLSALGTAGADDALKSLNTLKPLKSLKSLSSGCTSCALCALRTNETLRALRTDRSVCALRPGGPWRALGTLRTRAGCCRSIQCGTASRSRRALGARCTLWTACSAGTRWTLNALRANKTATARGHSNRGQTNISADGEIAITRCR
jgi:hypothetical protein